MIFCDIKSLGINPNKTKFIKGPKFNHGIELQLGASLNHSGNYYKSDSYISTCHPRILGQSAYGLSKDTIYYSHTWGNLPLYFNYKFPLKNMGVIKLGLGTNLYSFGKVLKASGLSESSEKGEFEISDKFDICVLIGLFIKNDKESTVGAQLIFGVRNQKELVKYNLMHGGMDTKNKYYGFIGSYVHNLNNNCDVFASASAKFYEPSNNEFSLDGHEIQTKSLEWNRHHLEIGLSFGIIMKLNFGS